MAEFAVCTDEEVISGRGKKVIIDGEEIALFKLDETIYAISNMCPHQKFQKLHEGMFENGVVTCPMHGWAYDVRTGVSTNASGKVKVFTAEVKRGKVFIRIDPPVQ
jgi:nitrite reductase/ring-hydroxylating ferredoxin subunit